MIQRIAIGTSSFGKNDDSPLRRLAAHGAEVVENPWGRRPTEEELLTFLPGFDGLIAGLEPLTERVLKAASDSLKAISRVGIGLDSVDLKAAERFGIKVSNTPDAPSYAVAENTVAMLLSIFRRIPDANGDMHRRQWQKALGKSLKGTSVLIVGYGRIGRLVSKLLKPLGCLIQVADPALSPAQMAPDDTLVDFRTGIQSADVITLHCSGGTTLLGTDEFAILKPGVTILNAARGELIDERALIDAITKRIVWRAWIDVFKREPYQGDLCDIPEVMLSPHNATFTQQCRMEMEMQAVDNLLNDLR